MKTTKINAILLGVSFLLPCYSQWAFSADIRENTQIPTDSAQVVDLDELVVVSQSKEYLKLRRQALSSTVLTNQEMEQLHVKGLNQLSSFVPSFVMPAYGARLTSSLYVRGIGSRTGNPAVGVYYDQIPLVSKNAYNQHFYGINRVDIIRGPQGTLYGLNAEGGVVRIYSKNPMDYQGTDISLSMASGLCSDVELEHYHRMSDKMAFSVSAFYSGQKGFFHHQNFKDRADLSNEAGGKVRLVMNPNKKLTLDLIADYQYVNQNGFGYGEYADSTGKWNNPASTIMNGYRRQMVNTGLRASYDMGDYLLHSATGYQYLNDAMQMDQDYLPEDYMRLKQDQKMNAITQELTFRNKNHDRWYAQTSGIFFNYQWLRTDGPVFFGDDMNRMIISQMGMPPYVASSLSLSDNDVPGTFHTPQLNLGLYHESNLKVADELTLTLGLRYDYQRHSISYQTESHFTLAYQGMIQNRPVSTAHRYVSELIGSDHTSYHQLLPKVALTWQVADNGSQVYLSVAKGFRAGGYNLQMFSGIFKTEQQQLGKQMMQLMNKDMRVEHSAEDYQQVNQTISYKPETTWNYELGTHTNLLDRRMQLDAAIFFMQIRNQQLSILAGNFQYGRMMVNAGRSNSCGAELSLRSVSADAKFNWSATYSFTHTTFRHYVDDEVSYRGQYVPFVPRHSMSLTGQYQLLPWLAVGAHVSGMGPIYWDIANTLEQKFYVVGGANVRLTFGDFQLNVWSRNLTNTHYNNFLVESKVDGVSRGFSQRANPFQLGVDLSLHL